MQGMRDWLRRDLGRTLRAMPEIDRLQAAWPVACGPALAGRGTITGFAGGTVEIEAADSRWLDEMLRIRVVLEAELGRIAGVPLQGIHFRVKSRR